jgi:hypothetical protein
MEMIEVNLFDNNFTHSKSHYGVYTSTYKYPPKEIFWEYRHMNYDGITVFTDFYITDSLVDDVKSNLKIAWLMEPPAIHPWTYENIVKVEDKFDYILTFEESLLNRSSKYIKYIVGQSRVTDDVANIYDKNKHMSLISSGKGISDGHRYRGEVVDKLHSKYLFDLWGHAHKTFEEKTEPLKDYEFSIAITNSRINNYFTEILLDCFRLGTIPIFWGCPNIDEYFNLSGMEIFNTIEELDYVLSNLKPYKEYLPGAKENFELCKQYIHTDDYIARILKKL